MRIAKFVAVAAMVFSIPAANAATGQPGGGQTGPVASPEIQLAAAQCFGKQKATWPQLIEACTKLLKVNVNPDIKAGAHYNRGAAYLKYGANSTAKALADFDAALKIKPAFARALAARGSVYVGQQKFDQAIADLSKAITLDAKSSAAFNNRGMAYLGKHNYEKAIADLTKAIELDPKDGTSYGARGSAYMISDKTKAMDDFNKALSLNPQDTLALYNRGILHVAQGEKAKAKADFEAVLAVIPTHVLAKKELTALAKAGG